MSSFFWSCFKQKMLLPQVCLFWPIKKLIFISSVSPVPAFSLADGLRLWSCTEGKITLWTGQHGCTHTGNVCKAFHAPAVCSHSLILLPCFMLACEQAFIVPPLHFLVFPTYFIIYKWRDQTPHSYNTAVTSHRASSSMFVNDYRICFHEWSTSTCSKFCHFPNRFAYNHIWKTSLK